MSSYLTFLNATLLFGVAAFAIPLIIHLLHRTRYTTLDWGAMLFLDDVSRVQTRRWEWQKWLLLLLRCGIPIVLALCMARPLLPSRLAWDGWGGAKSRSTIVLVDNTLSMEARSLASTSAASASQLSLSQRARQAIFELIQGSPASQTWLVRPFAASPRKAESKTFTRDRDRLVAELDSLPPGAAGSDLLAQLDTALDTLVELGESGTQLIVFSDFQRTMCQSLEANRIANWRARFDALKNPPRVLFLPVEQEEKDANDQAPPSNVTVRIASQTRSLVGVGQPFEVRVLVKSFSTKAFEEIKVVLVIDGLPIASKAIALPPQGETQQTFGMSFTDKGSHHIEARIEIDDALPVDNSAHWSVLALEKIPLLLVEADRDQPNELPDQVQDETGRESRYLAAALSPFADHPTITTDLFQVTRVEARSLSAELLGRHRIVLFVDVPQFDLSITPAIEAFVRRGNTFAIFPGDRFESRWFHQQAFGPRDATLPSDGSPQVPLLPAVYADRSETREPQLSGLKIQRQLFQHPGVSFLNDPRNGGLEQLEIRRWYPLRLASEASNQGTSTVLSLSNGDPFLVEGTVGEGRILQYATAVNDRWSNWPLRPIFLPMIQQTLLSTTPPARWAINATTAQSLSLPSPVLLEWLNTESVVDDDSSAIPSATDQSNVANATLFWECPGEWKSEESPEAEPSASPLSRRVDPSRLEAPAIAANFQGTYRVGGVSETPFYLSVQSPIEESSLERESETALRSLADRLGVGTMASVDDYLAAEDPSRRELWRWLLIGLLILLFGEVWLQRRMTEASG